ncbi:TPA: glycosyltransferase family 2 protein [Photobacterium damselae]
MKVSIITVCYNSEKTIEDTIKSIAEQTYKNIEYIIIDGGSKDKTNDIVNKHKNIFSIHLSEPDNGLYDAMNKGIKLATGDLIGILNSDDILYDKNVIENIVLNIGDYDGIYADVGFYDQDLVKKTRHYSSDNFVKEKFSRGFMPAHPSFYVRKEHYKTVGDYNLNYKIAADFDMLLRLFNLSNVKFKYLNQEVVKMRIGGVSTSGISSNITLNKEILESCRNNNIPCSWLSILSKYPEKIVGLLR